MSTMEREQKPVMHPDEVTSGGIRRDEFFDITLDGLGSDDGRVSRKRKRKRSWDDSTVVPALMDSPGQPYEGIRTRSANLRPRSLLGPTTRSRSRIGKGLLKSLAVQFQRHVSGDLKAAWIPLNKQDVAMLSVVSATVRSPPRPRVPVPLAAPAEAIHPEIVLSVHDLPTPPLPYTTTRVMSSTPVESRLISHDIPLSSTGAVQSQRHVPRGIKAAPIVQKPEAVPLPVASVAVPSPLRPRVVAPLAVPAAVQRSTPPGPRLTAPLSSVALGAQGDWRFQNPSHDHSVTSTVQQAPSSHLPSTSVFHQFPPRQQCFLSVDPAPCFDLQTAESHFTAADWDRFVSALPTPNDPSDFLSVSCEYAGPGGTTCICIVDYDGNELFNDFVQPTKDNRKRYSRPGDLSAVSFGFAREAVKAAIRDKIVVGHNLIQVFTKLNITHPWIMIRDTATCFPLMLEYISPRQGCVHQRKTLNELASRHLAYDSQHKEDAQIAMDIYKVVQIYWDANIFEYGMMNHLNPDTAIFTM